MDIKGKADRSKIKEIMMVNSNIKNYLIGVFSKNFRFLSIFLIAAFVLWKGIYWRISHTYLEDDVVWFFPVIDHLLSEANSTWLLLKSFHLPELTLFDALYFTFLKLIFGYNFFLYPLPSYLIHLVNSILIYRILSRAFNCSLFTSGMASLIYMTFYGHYHAYLWPMAMHHTLGVFWMLFFIYEYLCDGNIEMQNQAEKLRSNWKLYGLAFLASFMRLSILIVPLTIGSHILLSNSSREDIYLKIKRWLPIFLLISWYQALNFIIGNRADVLGDFLNAKNLIALGSLIFVFWFLVRRNLQRIYYFWLVIPFVFMLCLYLWLFPQNTLAPSNVALRWQIMPLPAGPSMWFFLILSWWIMFTFTQHVLYRNKNLGVFIIWYMLVFPYLISRLDAMPSRYLIYLSPIFAIVLAVFLGEIICNHFKGFHKNIFQLAIGCSFAWFGIINIQTIHERSVRSFVADYHWKYDDIMMAQYIKQDLTAKGISANESILCLQGINRMSYLENWAQAYLKGDQKLDGYESLKITLASLLGMPKAHIRINEICKADEISYDFRNDNALYNFRWPANLKKEDSWEIYGNSFDGDSESVRIDNILQHRINFFDQGQAYWPLKQGCQVERYYGFDIYDFKDWYFAIPQDESFNLARFKIGDYYQTHFAKTKYEIRQWIDSKFPHDYHASKILQGEPSNISYGEYIFRIKLLGVQLGYLYLKNETILPRDGRKLCRISLVLKPWAWLQRISGDRIGFKMTSVAIADNLLPIEFEQIDLLKLKKGRPGRKIIYHRDELFMERRGYKEDINFDTRDLVTMILWVFSNSHANHKTTINIERNLFALEVTPISFENNKTSLELRVKSLDKKGKDYNWFVILNQEEDNQMPKSIILKVGSINVSLTSFH